MSIRIIRSKLSVQSWLDHDPTAEQVRPSRCVNCRRYHRKGCRIHGNGRRSRTVAGPDKPGGKPKDDRVLGRRFRCITCGCRMLVVPSEVAPWYRYSLSAILYALALWSLEKAVGGRVRKKVSPWDAAGFGPPHIWSSLRRWVRRRAQLWPAVHVPDRTTMRETAAALVAALVARLSPAPALARAADAFRAARAA